MSEKRLVLEKLIGDFDEEYGKKYDPNTGKLTAHWRTRGPSTEFEYDEEGKLILESIDEDQYWADSFEVFHKVVHEYKGSVHRSIKYKTGYKDYKDFHNYDHNYDPPRAIPMPIYETNEIEEIRENFYNECGNLIELRYNNLKGGEKEITKFKYNSENNLVAKSKFIENKLIFQEIFTYNKNQILIEKTINCKNDEIKIIYNAEGLKTSKECSYQKIVYKYNEDGVETERIIFSKRGEERVRIIYNHSYSKTIVEIKTKYSEHFYLKEIIDIPHNLYNISLGDYLNEDSNLLLEIDYYRILKQKVIRHIKILKEPNGTILEQLYVNIQPIPNRETTEYIQTGISIKNSVVDTKFTWVLEYQ